MSRVLREALFIGTSGHFRASQQLADLLARAAIEEASSMTTVAKTVSRDADRRVSG
jgi:hypothetical protein